MSPTGSAFEVVGLDADDARLYRRLLPLTGRGVETCAASLEVGVEEIGPRLSRLRELGAVEIDDGVVRVLPPARLLADRVASESESLRAGAARLEQLRNAIPALRDMLADPQSPGELAGGELLEGGDVPALLESWIRTSTGDLMWLRPDQWRLPSESPMRAVVADAVAAGRRCRAIYPARALEEAPEAILDRIGVGEEVRIVAEVPSRMAIIGEEGVLLPEVWGENNDRRLRVRQPALQGALTALFEEMWARGIALAPPSPGTRAALTAEQARRLLLEQLAAGAKDEQMARALGVSLRTIRRRVAELLLDLDVDSRFQAGVEAVRRGLI